MSSRLFSMPDVPVFVLAGPECRAHDRAADPRSFVGHARPDRRSVKRDRSPAAAITASRISAIGGRATATSLVDAGLVQDLYLTTSGIDAGEPDTPWYVGNTAPSRDLIVRKKEDTPDAPIVFEHFALRS